jgi:hypothetical protein
VVLVVCSSQRPKLRWRTHMDIGDPLFRTPHGAPLVPLEDNIIGMCQRTVGRVYAGHESLTRDGDPPPSSPPKGDVFAIYEDSCTHCSHVMIHSIIPCAPGTGISQTHSLALAQQSALSKRVWAMANADVVNIVMQIRQLTEDQRLCKGSVRVCTACACLVGMSKLQDIVHRITVPGAAPLLIVQGTRYSPEPQI